MASNSGMFSSIERLKGRDNYDTWKFVVQAYFEHEDMWQCVVGTDTTDAKKLIKAKTKLILLVDPINHSHIKAAETAKDIWIALKNAFEDNGLTRRVGLLHTLITTRLCDSISVEAYVNQLVNTAHKLKGVGMDIPDEWIGTLLLAGLPDEYRPMIMGLESSGIKITADSVKTKILQDVKSSAAAESEIDELAMFNKQKFARRHQSNYTKNGMRCYECNGFGHYAKHCKAKNKKSAQSSAHASWVLISSSCLLSNANITSEWYIDSGATSHMTMRKNILRNKSVSSIKNVVVADNTSLPIECVGEVRMSVLNGNNVADLTIKKVQCVPKLCTNLLSVSQLVRNGYKVVFDDNGCVVYDRKSKKLVLSATMVNNMFRVDCAPANRCYKTADNDETMLWHRRLGHANEQYVKKTFDLVSGMQYRPKNVGKCVACVKGKQTRNTFKNIGSRAQNILDLVHSDVCGPMTRPSIGSALYYVIFVDDFSRKVFLFTMKTKDEVTDKFIEFKNRVERESGRKIGILRSDNGGEYVNKRLKDILIKCGIKHQTTAPYTSEQNGVAERYNRSIVEKARCMLFDANLGKGFWAEAASTAAYIINRLPCNNNARVTPEEAWSGKKPDVSAFRVFGSKAMVHVPKQLRQKFDAKSSECIMVGYCENTKAYRLYDPSKRKITVSRDVVFFEDSRGADSHDAVGTNKQYIEKIKESTSAGNFNPQCNSFSYTFEEETEDESPAADESIILVDDSLVDGDQASDTSAEFDDAANDEDYEPDSESPSPSSSSYSDDTEENNSRAYVVSQIIGSVGDPQTVRDALASPDSKHWKRAMEEEYHSLLENDTWELVNAPADRKPINSKWVFKVKRDSNGNIIRHKARLVVKGYAQQHGIDYDETYAPVVRHTSIRYLLAIAVKRDLIIHQMDAVTAFLQSDLDECIYMHQPECFHDGSQKVCRLKKSLYGLKQASRVWNSKLNEALVQMGFVRSSADPCVYHRTTKSKFFAIAVYVDDFILISDDQKAIDHLKSELSTKFKMKDMGEISSVLGINIVRDRKSGLISIDQTQYIQGVLERFGMTDSNPAATPMDRNQKLSLEMCPIDQRQRADMVNVPYQEAIGSIMYAAQLTRPDVCFAISTLSRFNQNPGRAHWTAVKRVLRYLKGTVDAKLTYSRNGNPEIIGYCDADYANDINDRRSTTGYVFVLYGAAISWNAKKQPTVALSTTEAEYMSMCAATQEAIWLRTLHNDLFPSKNETLLNCDNKSAICIASNNMYSNRTKHIDVKFHFIREKIADKSIKLNYVSTKSMIADILTKSVTTDTFKRLAIEFGLNY